MLVVIRLGRPTLVRLVAALLLALKGLSIFHDFLAV
jgi:hypothetical protein